jgi:hypothetical protein
MPRGPEERKGRKDLKGFKRFNAIARVAAFASSSF